MHERPVTKESPSRVTAQHQSLKKEPVKQTQIVRNTVSSTLASESKNREVVQQSRQVNSVQKSNTQKTITRKDTVKKSTHKKGGKK